MKTISTIMMTASIATVAGILLLSAGKVPLWMSALILVALVDQISVFTPRPLLRPGPIAQAGGAAPDDGWI